MLEFPQAITINTEKDCPLRPTICSADRFVSRRDPAIVKAPKSSMSQKIPFC